MWNPENDICDFLNASDGQKALGLKSSSGTSTSSQLNTEQLNRGGYHLNQQGQRDPETGGLVKSRIFFNSQVACVNIKRAQLMII